MFLNSPCTKFSNNTIFNVDKLPFSAYAIGGKHYYFVPSLDLITESYLEASKLIFKCPYLSLAGIPLCQTHGILTAIIYHLNNRF